MALKSTYTQTCDGCGKTAQWDGMAEREDEYVSPTHGWYSLYREGEDGKPGCLREDVTFCSVECLRAWTTENR